MFENTNNQPKRRERSNKCRVSTRKRADGTTIKEISNCTKEQIMALKDMKDDD